MPLKHNKKLKRAITIINKDPIIRNIPQPSFPFILYSSIPIIAKRIPSNKDDIGPYEKSFVINPYIEIATTIKASITIIIFNLVLPQLKTDFSFSSLFHNFLYFNINPQL